MKFRFSGDSRRSLLFVAIVGTLIFWLLIPAHSQTKPVVKLVLKGVGETRAQVLIRDAFQAAFPGADVRVPTSPCSGQGCLEIAFPEYAATVQPRGQVEQEARQGGSEAARQIGTAIGSEAASQAYKLPNPGASPTATAANTGGQILGGVLSRQVGGSLYRPDHFQILYQVNGGQVQVVEVHFSGKNGRYKVKEVGHPDKHLNSVKEDVKFGLGQSGSPGGAEAAEAVCKLLAQSAARTLKIENGYVLPGAEVINKVFTDPSAPADVPAMGAPQSAPAGQGDGGRPRYQRRPDPTAVLDVPPQTSEAEAKLQAQLAQQQLILEQYRAELRRLQERLDAAGSPAQPVVSPSANSTSKSSPGIFHRPLKYVEDTPKMWANRPDTRAALARAARDGLALLDGDDLVLGPRWRLWWMDKEKKLVAAGVKDIVPDGALEGEAEYAYWNQQLHDKPGDFTDPPAFVGKRSTPPPSPPKN
jgi:hypothetical protein